MYYGACVYHLVQLFSYTAVAGASMLLVLRTYVFHGLRSDDNKPMGTSRIAIWNRDKIVSTIIVCIWWTNISFLIHSKSVLPIAGS